MKNLLLKKILYSLMILVFVSGGIYAQRNVKLQESINKGQKLFIELTIADDIKVRNWSGNEVKINGTVNIDNNKYNDEFEFVVERSSGKLIIETNYKDLNKLIRKDKEKDKGYEMKCNFEVLIPENITIGLSTVNGNIDMDGDYGNVMLNSVSGNVELTGNYLDVDMNSVSGEVDITVSSNIKADFQITTVTGDVFSDLDFEKPKSKKWMVGHNINESYNGGGKDIKLVTVTGDLYVRKR